MNKLYTIKEVKDIVKLSTITIRRLIKSNNFPKPINLNVIKHLWLSTDIDNWLNNFKKD
jgi:predicted DNA-binding transcriptional regulator AlpA